MKLIGVALPILGVAIAAAQDVPRPRIVGVPHAAFTIHDIAASRHFYKDFLGYNEPFDINGPDGKLIMAFIKINDRQYVELQVEANPEEPRFRHLALQTDDAEALRQYVKSKGFKAPDKPASRVRIGNVATGLDDPDGNHIDVTQYEPEGASIKDLGKDMPDTRIDRKSVV